MEIITKTRFEKDIKKLKKRQKKIFEIRKNHPLVENWQPCYELHIEPDWLLIYYVDVENNKLILYRTGTHSGSILKLIIPPPNSR